MSNKSILFICPNLGSGGSEKMLVKIANHCSQMGMKCEFLLLDSRNQHYQLANEVVVHHLNLSSMKFSFLPIIKKVRAIKPDIVFSTVTIMNVVVVISSLLFPKVKLIARESSIISINNRYSKIGFLIDWAIKILYKRFDLIVAQSFAMKDDLVNNYAIAESKIVQIYNPVDIIPGAQPRVNQKNEKITFLSVGNLRREKGYDRLLKVLAKLELDFIYYIVGKGVAEEQKLKTLCSELHLMIKLYL
ncbi:MAG: glycosyltransferase [Saprospiraceae bacterium]|nr:glycosyltransferase [Saprospiraceae bacterium]